MVKIIFISFHLYVSNVVQHQWENIQCITSVSLSRRQLLNHIVQSWKAITIGEDSYELPPEDVDFNKKVSFFEATSESIMQFTIGDIIIRTYGISDDITTKFFQLFGLASSMFSLIVAFITVSACDIVIESGP